MQYSLIPFRHGRIIKNEIIHAVQLIGGNFIAAHILPVEQLNYIKKIFAVARLVAVSFSCALQVVAFSLSVLNRQQQHTAVYGGQSLDQHSFIPDFNIRFKAGNLHNPHQNFS